MIDVTFTFNGYDFSPLLSTYNVSYKIESEQITTLDGTEHSASRKRPVIEFSLVPLSDSQSAAVYSALSAITASTTYTNPHTNSNVTAVMRVASSLGAAFGLKSYNGNRYYKGGTITLRQKTVV